MREEILRDAEVDTPRRDSASSPMSSSTYFAAPPMPKPLDRLREADAASSSARRTTGPALEHRTARLTDTRA